MTLTWLSNQLILAIDCQTTLKRQEKVKHDLIAFHLLDLHREIEWAWQKEIPQVDCPLAEMDLNQQLLPQVYSLPMLAQHRLVREQDKKVEMSEGTTPSLCMTKLKVEQALSVYSDCLRLTVLSKQRQLTTLMKKQRDNWGLFMTKGELRSSEQSKTTKMLKLKPLLRLTEEYKNWWIKNSTWIKDPDLMMKTWEEYKDSIIELILQVSKIWWLMKPY